MVLNLLFFFFLFLLWIFVQSLDEAHSSPGLHAAAGTGLAEECATLVLPGILLHCTNLVDMLA